MTVQEAGRKGGLTLVGKKDHAYFVSLGEKGQKVLRERYPDMAKEWGKKGGRPKKKGL